MDVVMFAAFTLIYLGSQLIIVLSFSYSQRAGVNEGIITSIWAVTPLFGAVIDFIAFGVRLSTKHSVSVIALVACAACISLSSIGSQSKFSGSED